VKTRIALAVASVLLFGGVCSAQTRITGAFQCARPDPHYVLPIAEGDATTSPAAPAKTGHVLVLQQSACTWTKPPQIAGSTPKDGRNSSTSDVNGARSRDLGYIEINMDSGAEFTLRYTGMALLTDGVAQKMTGTWTLLAGTGKLKGITGRGTYNGAGNADGSTAVQIVGEYQIPQK
jgi:hypothetical protein